MSSKIGGQKMSQKKSCSFHTKSKNGKNIGGTAAFLKLSSQQGGIDNLLHKIATTAYEQGRKEGAEKTADIILSNLKKGGKIER